MKRRTAQHHIDGLLALLLFGVFAACVLAVLFTGADAYRRLTERDRAAYDRRTCLQYVAQRVRQAEHPEAVSVENFGGVDALVLNEGEYVTRLYCWDGQLMELYCAEDEALEPVDGEYILESGSLAFTLEDGLLTVTSVDTRGEESRLQLSLRRGEGAAA